MLLAICTELSLRKKELPGPVQTIYLGGGTPSLLSGSEIEMLLASVYEHFNITKNPEITLEANPDDLTEEKIESLKNSKINRLSIGVQSFFSADLKLMNRAHTAKEAVQCIKKAKRAFKNISIDLIYGTPNMTNKQWEQNIDKALSFNIPHLSCYALTVEPKTALERQIKNGALPPVSDGTAARHHKILIKKTEAAGYENYEFSNFCKPGHHSQNNTGYWHGKPYLGVGPAAHSYDGRTRSWNIANNALYLKNVQKNILPIKRETLTKNDKYNEHVMTRLRTRGGIQLSTVRETFGKKYHAYMLQQAKKHIDNGLLLKTENTIAVTKKGKFLSDGIASDLFLLHL